MAILLVLIGQNATPYIRRSPNAGAHAFELNDLAVIDKEVHLRAVVLDVPGEHFGIGCFKHHFFEPECSDDPGWHIRSPGLDQWSPDGKSIAYLRSTSDGNFIMYDQPLLCVMPAEGGEPKIFSRDLDRPVSNPRWNKDGNSIAVLVTDDCRRYIASYEFASGKMQPIIEGDRVFASIELNPNGTWLTTMSDPETPSEFYALENGNLRKLTKTQDEFLAPLTWQAFIRSYRRVKMEIKYPTYFLFRQAATVKKCLQYFLFMAVPLARTILASILPGKCLLQMVMPS